MTPSHNEIFSKVLYLTSWPPLEQLLLETAKPMTRICALLARRPSVGMFIPVVLDMPPEIIYPLLQMLHEKGHISQTANCTLKESCHCQASTALTDPQQLKVSKLAQDPAPSERTLSFFDLLWRRLTETGKPDHPEFV